MYRDNDRRISQPESHLPSLAAGAFLACRTLSRNPRLTVSVKPMLYFAAVGFPSLRSDRSLDSVAIMRAANRSDDARIFT